MKRLLLFSCLCVLLVTRSAAAVPITLVPSSFMVEVGLSFDVDVTITDVTDLFVYGFDLVFDPFFFSASTVTDGGFLTSDGGTSAIAALGFAAPLIITLDNGAGLITLADLLEGPIPPGTGATGSGVLARVRFTALSAGTSDLSLANIILENSENQPPLSAEPVGASVTVQEAAVVPEPTSLLLLGSGTLALARLRRSRRRRA